MRIYPLKGQDGRWPFAFEVENAYIGPAAAARVLRGVDGVTDVGQRRMFSSSSDLHATFTYLGRPCIVWEPWADSTRYWIGPGDQTDAGDISALAEAFRRYRPPLHRAVLGDILTLKFITRLLKS